MEEENDNVNAETEVTNRVDAPGSKTSREGSPRGGVLMEGTPTEAKDETLVFAEEPSFKFDNLEGEKIVQTQNQILEEEEKNLIEEETDEKLSETDGKSSTSKRKGSLPKKQISGGNSLTTAVTRAQKNSSKKSRTVPSESGMTELVTKRKYTKRNANNNYNELVNAMQTISKYNWLKNYSPAQKNHPSK